MDEPQSDAGPAEGLGQGRGGVRGEAGAGVAMTAGAGGLGAVLLRPLHSSLGNFVLFQGCWFACAYSDQLGRWWLGPLAVSLFVGLECLRQPVGQTVMLALGAGGVGLVLDGLQVLAGGIHFPAVSPVQILSVPLWMVALWVGFGCCLEGSLSWMKGRYGASVLFGAIGGPLSYLAGQRVGALTLGEPLAQSLVMVGLEWAVAMPVLLKWVSFVLSRPFKD